jgi:hypothetical protein
MPARPPVVLTRVGQQGAELLLWTEVVAGLGHDGLQRRRARRLVIEDAVQVSDERGSTTVSFESAKPRGRIRKPVGMVHLDDMTIRARAVGGLHRLREDRRLVAGRAHRQGG